MPARAPRSCRAFPCPDTTNHRSGFCDNHSDLRSGWAGYQDDRTPEQRGYGKEWRRLRKEALERDSYLCQICRRHGVITQANEVDHIKSKSAGGDDDLNNLQSLCAPCHAVKTIKERRPSV